MHSQAEPGNEGVRAVLFLTGRVGPLTPFLRREGEAGGLGQKNTLENLI